MKMSLKTLRGQLVQRLVIESVDLSLYIAHAEVAGKTWLVADDSGAVLKTRNLLDMKRALAGIPASARVLRQRSAYDEMIGAVAPSADNTLELPLWPGYESLPG